MEGTSNCENLKEKKLHGQLKSFLIDVGKKEGYKSFSGDSECLDIRLKRKRVEYKPDVVWKDKTSCHVFELAFTEDWRAVIGEFTLAWLAGCSSFSCLRLAEIIEHVGGAVFPQTELRLFRNAFGILGDRFGVRGHFLSIYHLEESPKDARLEKDQILIMLRKKHLIAEETAEAFSQ